MVGGIAITILVDARNSNGLYGMVETVAPSGGGPPPHAHSREDETFHVIQGTAEFTVGGTKTTCGPGSVVYGPRGIAHGYRNVGDGDLRVVIIYTPGGVEEIFQDWADDGRRVADIMAGYGVTLVG